MFNMIKKNRNFTGGREKERLYRSSYKAGEKIEYKRIERRASYKDKEEETLSENS
jgi:hypothetical protein